MQDARRSLLRAFLLLAARYSLLLFAARFSLPGSFIFALILFFVAQRSLIITYYTSTYSLLIAHG